MNNQHKIKASNASRVVKLLLPLICLYIMILFGFNIQVKLPNDCQLLYPIVFLVFYFLFFLLTPKLVDRFKITHIVKNLLVIAFILANSILLYSLSSIMRESEIHKYVDKNEQELKSIIAYSQNNDSNKTRDLCRKLNINSFFPLKGHYYFKLYTFMGYGYGLIFSDGNRLTVPKTTPGGSPIVNWIQINEQWYYYSYFD